MVSRWNYYSPQQERQDHSHLAKQVRRRAPELIDEWTSLDESERGKAIGHLRIHGVAVPDDAGLATIGKHTIKQLNIFAHKATLCLYFERFKTPLPNTGLVSAHWRSKEDFAQHGVPPIFFELFPEYGTLVQGKWNAAETFEYRYAFNEADGLFGCLARFRTSLFVTGFAMADSSRVREKLGDDWIRPIQLLGDNPHFARKQ
ncbi:hypothetical protein [Bradyrhizobium sp. 62]|uniref:hypothetical protein n=1 Tax=Bradyrhizobium sp. 62 TaxID=1043588 RepID=UPI001FF8BB44|nr:hypothetical protein [Bradyrhizobium sp. 62]